MPTYRAHHNSAPNYPYLPRSFSPGLARQPRVHTIGAK